MGERECQAGSVNNTESVFFESVWTDREGVSGSVSGSVGESVPESTDV